MTNIGNEKSPNRVHRNIVPIVPVPPMKSTQTIEHQSLRGRNNKNFIVPGPYFPAFYRSICSRIPVFVVQTKGSEECSNGLHHRSIRQTLQTTDRHMTRLGTGPPSRIRDGGLHHQPNPVRKYGRNWFGHGAYEIPAPGT